MMYGMKGTKLVSVNVTVFDRSIRLFLANMNSPMFSGSL